MASFAMNLTEEDRLFTFPREEKGRELWDSCRGYLRLAGLGPFRKKA